MSDKQIKLWFPGAVALVALIYICFDLTPSSYGVFLEAIQAPDAGPVFGTSRPIRSDEWSVDTPLMQAAVRNRFQRVNETSFYREDLRSFVALPLKDWSLVFKPQLWAFFLLPPSTAFSIYWAFFMCAFLIGYFLLFRDLGAPDWFSAAAAVIVYFSGFTQFWWTTVGPMLACLPWVLLIILRPMPWWRKALLCVWAFPTLVFGYAYPVPLITLGWGALIVILAFRPQVLRSPGTIAAIAAGAFALVVVLFLYYGDTISIISNTIYPGLRRSHAGGTSILAVVSELFPFLSFRLGDYQHLDGENICEIGTVGSFLPLLTLCLMDYRSLREHPAVRRTLLVLLAGFIAITLWEIAPLPDRIGRILIWNRGASERWLFISGLLLTLAALAIWSNKLISVSPFRMNIFVVVGPVASIFLKVAWLMHKGESFDVAFGECRRDVLLCMLAIAAGVAAWYTPTTGRAVLLLFTLAFMNVYAFGRFNPLQPAGPIFDVPETDIVHALRERAAASPGGALIDRQSSGATLNGLGLRSASHFLVAPQLAIFRSYFPAMDEKRFNQIFNRIGHVQVASIPRPNVLRPDVIEVPIEAFRPVRNARRVLTGPSQPGICAQPTGGGIDHVSAQGTWLTIDGWAPWKTELDEQGLRVLSSRSLSGSLLTVQRPDLAERFQDYDFVKSGFRLQISSGDGKPLRPEELVLIAVGTAQGEVRLGCCGCP
jgi:hypothetical protein